MAAGLVFRRTAHKSRTGLAFGTAAELFARRPEAGILQLLSQALPRSFIQSGRRPENSYYSWLRAIRRIFRRTRLIGGPRRRMADRLSRRKASAYLSSQRIVDGKPSLVAPSD